jgi:hypothetical protein
MKLQSRFMLAVVFLYVAAACKKDKDSVKPTCRVTTLSSSGALNSVLNISYDGTGRIASANRDSITSNFSYTSSGVVILTLNRNRLTTRTTVEFTQEKLVTKVTSLFIHDDGSESLDHVDTYEYNERGELLKKISQAGNNVPSTTTYIWGNGNVVSDSEGFLYEYVADREIQDSDPLRIADLVSTGGIIFKNKNLLRRIARGSTGFSQEFSYSFDSEGKMTRRIMTLTANGGSATVTSDIQYVCN